MQKPVLALSAKDEPTCFIDLISRNLYKEKEKDRLNEVINEEIEANVPTLAKCIETCNDNETLIHKFVSSENKGYVFGFVINKDLKVEIVKNKHKRTDNLVLNSDKLNKLNEELGKLINFLSAIGSYKNIGASFRLSGDFDDVSLAVEVDEDKELTITRYEGKQETFDEVKKFIEYFYGFYPTQVKG